jgi:S-(hydroxymethyl)glutathione dehydrogenase/alcohol dehydrogenase
VVFSVSFLFLFFISGFYIDATNAPWSQHYKMESYISQELPAFVEAEWGVGLNGVRSLAGHSMGGHGALTLGLKAAPGAWASVSAFAPICNPTQCPWGEKAFTNYFGSVDAGKDHDATILIQTPGKAGMFDDILIDEGTNDNFGKEGQLLLSNFEEAAAKVGQKLTVRRQPGHDHSYYFIAAFIADHIAFHAKRLRAAASKAAEAAVSNELAALEATGTAGKPIKCKAMVARGPKQPLVAEEITVDVPKAGEVRVKVIANALCMCHDKACLCVCVGRLVSPAVRLTLSFIL